MINTSYENINQNTQKNFNKKTTENGSRVLIEYISYSTTVAFRYKDYKNDIDEFVICENCWGNTTGKHLNWLNRDKKIRIESSEFDEKLKDAEDKIYNNIYNEKLLEGFTDSEDYQNAVYLYLKRNERI